MKRKEFKETLFETLNNVVDGMSYDDTYSLEDMTGVSITYHKYEKVICE